MEDKQPLTFELNGSSKQNLYSKLFTTLDRPPKAFFHQLIEFGDFDISTSLVQNKTNSTV